MEIKNKQSFFEEYNQTMNVIRNKAVTDEVIEEFSSLNPSFAKFAAGSNMIESALLLKKLQPDLAQLLFNMGGTFIDAVEKEIATKEKLDDMLDSDPNMVALMQSLESTKDSKDAADG